MDILPLHLTTVAFPESHPQAGERGPVFCFAVVHPEGIVLFDTGVGVGHRDVDRWFNPVHRPLAEVFADHAMSASDVVAVVNSHLHFDHCGHNRLFAGPPIYVQAREYRVSRDADYTVREWVDFPGARYVLLDGDAEILPGVTVASTPGHTPGHQSLVVDEGGGPAVLAGQAVYTRQEWDGSTDPRRSGESSAWDRDAYRASVVRIRELNPTRVLFAHDGRQWGAKRSRR